VAGSGVKSGAAVEASRIKGLDRILVVENPAYDKVFDIVEERSWEMAEKRCWKL
jgi:electron transfer flavoprotein alpha subunit